MTTSDTENDHDVIAGRPPTAEEQFYLETAYKEPVESVKRIEETARFLIGAVATSSGLFVAALKLSAANTPASDGWWSPFLLRSLSILLLVFVLVPVKLKTGRDEPKSWKAAFLAARTFKYRMLLMGTGAFILGLLLVAGQLMKKYLVIDAAKTLTQKPEPSMAAEKKTFTILCPHCEKVFHVRYALAGSDPENPEDTGEVAVDCLYCRQTVMIEIPRKYIPEDNLLRGA